MSDKLKLVYIDTCPLIDLAQEKAGMAINDIQKQCVWFCSQALKASRARKLKIVTSFLTVAECTSIKDNLPQPPEEIKRFYDMLLLSGKGGIELVAITHSIAVRARNLRWIDGLSLKGADTIHVSSGLQMRCDELWTRDGKIWTNREKITQLGLKVVRPFETDVLPNEYRQVDIFSDDGAHGA